MSNADQPDRSPADARDRPADADWERLRLALLASQDGIWDWNLATDEVYFGPRYYEMAGYEADEFPHRLEEFTGRIHPEDVDRVMAIATDHLEGRIDHFAVEFRFRTKSGEWMWIQGKGTIVERSPEGRPLRFTGTHRDITGRKRAEEALRESETRLAESQDIAGLGTYTLDVLTGAWNCSPMMEKVFGIGPDYDHSIAGWLNLLHPDDHESMKAYFEREVIGQGRFFDREYRIVRPCDQTVRWVHGLGKLEFDAQGAPLKMIGTIQDITARKAAENAIRESEHKYRLLFETAGDAIYIHDCDGRILAVNSTACRQLGYAPEELMQLSVDRVDSPAESREAAARIDRVLKDGRMEFETFHRRKDGTTMPIEVSARRIQWDGKPAIISIGRDISERRRAARRLERINSCLLNLGMDPDDNIQRLTALCGELFEATCALYNRLDGGRLCSVAQWQAADGCNPAEPPEGRICHEVIRREAEDPLVVEDLPTSPYADKNSHAVRCGFRSFWGHGVRCHDRKVGSLCVVFRDHRKPGEEDLRLLGILASSISKEEEQKEARGKQDQLETALQHAQKLESVGRLAGGVAHDFNNMLGVILGHAELALDQIPSTSPLHAHIADIQQAAQRSADLTSQLLAFARKQTVTPRILDLNQAVDNLFGMLRRLIGENIDLDWQPASGPVPFLMDPSQFDQMLANLCVNARDAIEGTGTIRIAAGQANWSAEECARRPDALPGEFVWLSFSDTGCGMSPDTLAHVFEPFFTTKDVGRGTGLGLATVYGTVRQNRGFIDVESEPGRGTTFTLWFPRQAGPPSSPKEPAASVQTRSGHETVLLVEDEPDILKIGQAMLSRLGYQVLAAATPGEAMEIARSRSGSIDLLMTDVVMPEMNGRDLAKNLLAIHPDMQRLFMSGYPANVIARHGVLDPGVHFLQKPFTLQSLGQAVRSALDAVSQ